MYLNLNFKGNQREEKATVNPQEKSQKRMELASGEGRTEPLGATVNVQDPPKPPQSAVEGAPVDFSSLALELLGEGKSSP